MTEASSIFADFFATSFVNMTPEKRKTVCRRGYSKLSNPITYKINFHPLTVCFAGHPLNSGTRKAPTTNKNKSSLADQNKTL